MYMYMYMMKTETREKDKVMQHKPNPEAVNFQSYTYVPWVGFEPTTFSVLGSTTKAAQHAFAFLYIHVHVHVHVYTYAYTHSDVTDMQQWIGAINKAAGLYSSPPLAAPIGSR